MQKRFIFIRFPYLLTDFLSRKQPELKTKALALVRPQKGQIIIETVNTVAEKDSVFPGMTLADARAIAPHLITRPYEEDRGLRILTAMAEWCVRYTPLVTVEEGTTGTFGLWLDMTGGAHLFGGEEKLISIIRRQFISLGYDIHSAIADTAGGAWAVSYDDHQFPIVPVHGLYDRLSSLPITALRLSTAEAVRLYSLGLRQIGNLYHVPRGPLARRLGKQVMLRLDQALGRQEEALTPFRTPPVFETRAYAPDGIMVLDGLIHVLRNLLDDLCTKLNQDGHGLRYGRFQAFRFDGQVETIEIGTSGPSKSPKHLFKLFEEKAVKMNLGFGAESFVLSALQTEIIAGTQDHFAGMGEDNGTVALLPELIDRLMQRLSLKNIYGFRPRESHLPERNAIRVPPLSPVSEKEWPQDRPRPVVLLPRPELIDVVAPVPDYPPMMFRYKGKQHRIKHAEGPERIEAEWWRQKSELRDYYRLEDETGSRYWIYRLGHYMQDQPSRWYMHGFFG